METIGVVGFGTMGSGIAQACAAGGYDVRVVDRDDAALDRGTKAVERFSAAGVERGKFTEDARKEILARLSTSTDMASLAPASIVIEAVSEDLELKQTILRAIEAAVAPDALIATNTSALSVSSLAASLDRPERFIGLHFFNPAAIMPLVEVIRALQTGEEAMDRGFRFSESIGKSPIRTDDRPGFVVNRLLMPYLNHAIRELDEGLGTAEDIDTAVRLGLGHPMGPFELLDLIGLDTHHHATESAYHATGDHQLHPPPLIDRMVTAGWLGNKSGRGFRQWDEDRMRNSTSADGGLV